MSSEEGSGLSAPDTQTCNEKQAWGPLGLPSQLRSWAGEEGAQRKWQREGNCHGESSLMSGAYTLSSDETSGARIKLCEA